MRKIISLFFSAVIALTATIVTGCSQEIRSVMVSIVYEMHYEQTDTNFLMVLTPSVTDAALHIVDLDGALLPESKGINSDNGQLEDIKAGDVIVMTFNKKYYIRQETTIKLFTDGPSEVNISLRNVEVKKVLKNFILKIPLSYIEGTVILGENVNFFFNTADKTDNKPSHKAIIDEITDDKAVLTVAAKDMQVVINCLGLGCLGVS